jgi:hypothetical protein
VGDEDDVVRPFNDPMLLGLGRANSAPDIGEVCCCGAIVVVWWCADVDALGVGRPNGG